MSKGIPDDLAFHQEWRTLWFDPNGVQVEKLTSGWYDERAIAKSLLNDEYPRPTSTGFSTVMETRWVSDPKTESGQR